MCLFLRFCQHGPCPSFSGRKGRIRRCRHDSGRTVQRSTREPLRKSASILLYIVLCKPWWALI